ncbi:ABC transporter ATP-binding protein [bacterium]|nr:ABC transporter ATP-binding protein [bacterium]
MIRVNQLSYTYPTGNTPAIHEMDFQVQAGEIFGFLGPSGAGKSTTQMVLIGLLKGYGGQVEIDDRELSSIHSDYYESIGVAFEFPNLYLKLSALENLRFFKDLYRGETENPEELLEIVGLAADANKKVGEFSKGMKMRLNFVRAFLNKPSLVFLDEPTSGLDPTNAKTVKEFILMKKREGATIFLTTHNMHDADDLCDRVGFIVDGQLRIIDSPRNLKLDHGKKRVRVEYRTNGSLDRTEFDLASLGREPSFQELLQSGKIETIHSLEATLEEVFIEVTGRRLA